MILEVSVEDKGFFFHILFVCGFVFLIFDKLQSMENPAKMGTSGLIKCFRSPNNIYSTHHCF